MSSVMTVIKSGVGEMSLMKASGLWGAINSRLEGQFRLKESGREGRFERAEVGEMGRKEV
jgi:hypothetical protein